jgi:hypothetical protein
VSRSVSPTENDAGFFHEDQHACSESTTEQKSPFVATKIREARVPVGTFLETLKLGDFTGSLHGHGVQQVSELHALTGAFLETQIGLSPHQSRTLFLALKKGVLESVLFQASDGFQGSYSHVLEHEKLLLDLPPEEASDDEARRNVARKRMRKWVGFESSDGRYKGTLAEVTEYEKNKGNGALNSDDARVVNGAHEMNTAAPAHMEVRQRLPSATLLVHFIF